jgi:hypothetical protein
MRNQSILNYDHPLRLLKLDDQVLLGCKHENGIRYRKIIFSIFPRVKHLRSIKKLTLMA